MHENRNPGRREVGGEKNKRQDGNREPQDSPKKVCDHYTWKCDETLELISYSLTYM